MDVFKELMEVHVSVCPFVYTPYDIFPDPLHFSQFTILGISVHVYKLV